MNYVSPIIRGYFEGLYGIRPSQRTAAYMHGYRNGVADRNGKPFERVDVLRRRAKMIEGRTEE